MCNNMFSKSEPDSSFEKEYSAAKENHNVFLFNIQDLIEGNINKSLRNVPNGSNEELIYQGWMMTLEQYTDFYTGLANKGHKLINSPEQYINCHHFNNWYSLIEKYTPKSLIIEISDLRNMTDQVMAFIKENGSVIIKDYVSSLKHHWDEACFIPGDANHFHVAKVLATFFEIKRSENNLNGNLVVRQFVKMKSNGVHSKSGLPLSIETRSFVYKGKVISTSNYWEEGINDRIEAPKAMIKEIASKINSNFFTVDMAMLEDGTWICVEIGDGQVSSLPEKANKEEFYKTI